MVASSTLLALFSTLIASSAAKDYLCGDNKDAKISQLKRSGSLNYGTSTNPLESPMLVQLVYADKTRACAGSLITVSHVLTARECVDGVKPEDISVIYGPRTPYGGNASVKSAKSPSDANVDLVVLELAFAVEISDSTIPVCLGDTDDAAYSDYTGLHFGPKNKSEDNELARAMYLDVLLRKDEKECIEALGNDYNKDTQFCVGKRNMVFAEGVYTGGPILVRHQPSGRFLQVGIAIKADAENNYGSATRVSLYQKEIGELTGCFLIGAGLNSTASSKHDCEGVGTTTSTTTTTFDKKYNRLLLMPGPYTFEEAEKICLEMRGTVAAPSEPNFAEYLQSLPNHGPHWALYTDPWGSDTHEEDYVDCYAIDSSQTDSAGHYKVVTKSCSEKLPVVCTVVYASQGNCSDKKELYFNGNCYKIIGPAPGFDAKEGGKKCEEYGFKLASVHSSAENHAIRLLVADSKATEDGECVRLGLNMSGSGSTYDGSSFDFGYEPAGKGDGKYPWCPYNPGCAPSLCPSVVMHKYEHMRGKHCWDDVEDSRKCAALCKKKLE